VKELQAALAEERIKVSGRTIERDLYDLAPNFPVTWGDGKPRGWWLTRQGLFGTPSMDVVGALSLVLTGDLLRQIVPKSLREQVDGRLAVSKGILQSLANKKTWEWSEIVRYVPLGLQLQPPHVKPAVLEAIEKALLFKKCLKVSYQTQQAPQPSDWVLHPHAMILHGSTPYLVCSWGPGSDIRQLPLQRFLKAELTQDDAWRPENFSLTDYLNNGRHSFGAGKIIQLKAEINKQLAIVLGETPINSSQVLTQKGDKHYVEVKLRESWELEFWILSQADRMTVIKPIHLRDKLKGYIESTLANYTTVAEII